MIKAKAWGAMTESVQEPLMIAKAAKPVDRKIPLPAWAQVRRDLLGLIGRQLEKGEKLPSEQELADIYDVSRITVRQALAQLSDEGIIERKQGKGTFVSENSGVIEHDLRLSVHWRDHSTQAGHLASSRELYRSTNEIIPSGFSSLVSNKELKSEFTFIRRIHLVNQYPIGFVESWVSASIFPKLYASPLLNGSLSNTLNTQFSAELVSTDQILSLTSLSSDQASILETFPGDGAFLYLERQEASGELAVLSRTFWNGTRVKFRL